MSFLKSPRWLYLVLGLVIGVKTVDVMCRSALGADDGAASSAAPSDDWPMWRFDAGRSASASFAMPDSLELQWVRKFPPRVQVWDDPLNNDLMQYDRLLEPIIAEGKVFLGFNDSDRVVAYDASTGEEIWTYFTEGPVRFPPVYWHGKLFVASDDGFMHCLNAATGVSQWKLRGGPTNRKVLGNHRIVSMWPTRGGPVIQDGNLYFSASIWPFLGTFIYCVDAETGRVVWLNDGTDMTYIKQPHSAPSFAGVAPQGAFAVTGDSLVVPGGRSIPAVFDRHTGKLQHFLLDEGGKGNGGSLVLAEKQRFYVHTRVRGVRRFHLDTGKKTEFMVNEPVLSHDGLFAGTNAAISAMGPDDKVMWQIDADGSGDIIRVGKRLYAAGKDKLIAVELPHGDSPAQITWTAPVDGSVQRLLAGAGKLLAVTVDGRIFAFGAPGDAPAKEVVPKEEPNEPLKPQDDSLRMVQNLLPRPEMREGYGFVFAPESTELLDALLHATNLDLVVVESLPSRAAELRKHYLQAGLYGKRIAVHVEDPLRYQAPPYIAKVVWVGESLAKASGDPRALRNLLAPVRPYGGVARIAKQSSLSLKDITKSLEDVAQGADPQLDRLSDQFQVAEDASQFLLTRPGALPGSAPWTHLYGNMANTVKSNDQRVKLPLGILWFGGTSNLDVLPRHGHSPPEQVIGGRLFVEGMNSLSARDVYTGQLLWKREFEDLGTFDIYYDKTYKDTPLDTAYNQVHIPGANVRGTNYVVTPDLIYLVIKDRCVVMDVATGDTVRELQLPELEGGRKASEWAYLGVYDDILLAGTDFGHYTDRLQVDKDKDVEKKGNAWSSDRFGSLGLVAMDRQTGKKLWEITAQHSFLHNGIAAGDGRIYMLDKLPKTVEDRLKRRGQEPPSSYRLIAVDATTGQVTWQQTDNIIGTWLGYSEEHQVLLQASAAATDRSQEEVDKGMLAYRGADGTVLWQNLDLSYAGPCILYHDKIITNTKSYQTNSGVVSLLDGKPVLVHNPVTGGEQPWTYQRAYGCNTAIACENMLTFRSGAAGFYDLKSQSGTGNLGGFKSGCSSNLIAADGVLNAPDFTRTCSCGYQNQTSLALVHMPDLDVWSTGGHGSMKAGDVVRHVGVNLGATGDRRSEDGTLWLEFPYVSGDPAPLYVRYEGRTANTFRHHALTFQGGELPWVSASGVRNIESLTVGVVASDAKTLPSSTAAASLYTVKLYFAEPDEVSVGERQFDVVVDGKVLINDLDVAQEAGGVQRGIVRELRGISASGAITIQFKKSETSELGAIVSGIELIAE